MSLYLLLKGFSIDTSGLLMHTELSATCNDGSNLTKLSKTSRTRNIDYGILITLVISRGGQSYNEQDGAKKIV